MPLKQLGKLLKSWRKSHNLTVAEVAKLIDRDDKFIYAIEAGKKSISMYTLRKLLQISNPTKDELYKMYLEFIDGHSTQKH